MEDGTQKEVAEISRSTEKTRVQKYLKGKINVDELLAQVAAANSALR